MKYRSRKTEVGGVVFDSQREARRYQELLLLEKAGAIRDLQRQVKFVLIPAQFELQERFGKDGKPLKPRKRCLERECAYIADFVYWDDGLVVEDVKGFRTKSDRSHVVL